MSCGFSPCEDDSCKLPPTFEDHLIPVPEPLLSGTLRMAVAFHCDPAVRRYLPLLIPEVEALESRIQGLEEHNRELEAEIQRRNLYG
jgi:hypothetical protein